MDLIKLSSSWSEWKVVEQIGEGSFGKVYKVMRVHHGITPLAAVKVISIPKSTSEVKDVCRQHGFTIEAAKSYFEGVVTDVIKEIRLMISLKKKKNIVNIEEFEVVEKTGEIGWDIYIRMELLTSLSD
jgi:serine/threonine-protein kinase